MRKAYRVAGDGDQTPPAIWRVSANRGERIRNSPLSRLADLLGKAMGSSRLNMRRLNEISAGHAHMSWLEIARVMNERDGRYYSKQSVFQICRRAERKIKAALEGWNPMPVYEQDKWTPREIAEKYVTYRVVNDDVFNRFESFVTVCGVDIRLSADADARSTAAELRRAVQRLVEELRR